MKEGRKKKGCYSFWLPLWVITFVSNGLYVYPFTPTPLVSLPEFPPEKNVFEQKRGWFKKQFRSRGPNREAKESRPARKTNEKTGKKTGEKTGKPTIFTDKIEPEWLLEFHHNFHKMAKDKSQRDAEENAE